MARTLYRIYLYFVVTQLLNFAAYVSAMFLGALLQQAVSYSPPYYYYSSSDLRQQGALAVTALVITAIFAGVHYSLIRRDIAHDPGAARGAVRSFFLNYNQAGAALFVAIAGAFGLVNLGSSNNGSVSAFGWVIAFGVLFVLLEVERRRGQPDRGGALALQRLNYYLIQLVLLFFAIGFLLHAVGDTVNRILVDTGIAPDPCLNYPATYGTCYERVAPYLGDAWIAAAWAVLAWAGYGLLARGDLHSVLRAVFRYIGLAFGIGFLLAGVAQGLHSLFHQLFGAPSPTDSYYYGSYNSYYSVQAVYSFIPQLLVGLAVAVIYWLWLRSDARNGGVMGQETNHQASVALFGAESAAFFWIGLALTLGGIFERVVSGGNPPSADTWAVYIAIAATGLVYIPTALWLAAVAGRTGVTVPRRAFVYYQLAYGTLGAVLSLIFVVYGFVSNALGSPIYGWEQFARQGIANIIIGAIIVGLYVYLARREGWFTRQPASPEAIPAPPAAQTVESVLDDLLARRITRDEAAARVRALASNGS